MSIDLSQFHQVFFEESYEGLDVMESALLNLQPDNVDSETINEIFRAAHSIKGGSGTFGFSDVADFTHVVETLLDEIRGGERIITAETVELFLKSVDCIRGMINQLDAAELCNARKANQLKSLFEDILAEGFEVTNDTNSSAEKGEKVAAPALSKGGWKIFFKPDQDILRTGNDTPSGV